MSPIERKQHDGVGGVPGRQIEWRITKRWTVFDRLRQTLKQRISRMEGNITS
jgi:hypothetical protein